MTCVYDDSSNMDEEIEWISDASDYESDQETPSLPNGNSPIIWEVIKRSADRNLIEIFSMPTLLLFSHIDHLKRMQIIKKL